MPVYLVDKPLGPSSHDVVAMARRTLGTRSVGHAGTLDPLATGLLTLLVGDDTKLSPFLTGSEKSYLAWISFGGSSPTLDAEGPVTLTEPPEHLDGSHVDSVLREFLELRFQVPPTYSAVKRGGVAAYREARAGREQELAARPVAYHRIELLGFAATRAELPSRFAPGPFGWGPAEGGRTAPLPELEHELPTALIALRVAAGTYIRSFARDLGARLGVAAFLSGLLRTGAGRLDLSQALPLEELERARPIGALEALPYPTRRLSAEEAARVRHGQRLPWQLPERTALVDEDDRLVAVAETTDGRMKLLRVWS